MIVGAECGTARRRYRSVPDLENMYCIDGWGKIGAGNFSSHESGENKNISREWSLASRGVWKDGGVFEVAAHFENVERLVYNNQKIFDYL